jgi:gas vesicle protein
MDHANKSYAGEIMITLAAGLAIGFAAGILLAPKSGKETRKDLVEKGGELVEKSREGFEAARVKAAEAADMGKEFIDKSRGSFQKALKSMEETTDRAKKKVDNVVKKGKSQAKKVEEALS